MRIGLLVPMMGGLPHETVAGVVMSAVEIKVLGHECCLITVSNYSPHDRAREFLLDGAEANGCDYAFWIDSDTILPTLAFSHLFAALVKLEALDPRAAAISAHYFRRGFPYSTSWGKDLHYVDAVPGSDVIELHTAGLGCMVINLRKLPERRPRFKSGWVGEERIWEDGYFCEGLALSGWKLYGHPGVRCGHLDTMQVIDDKTADRLRAEALQTNVNAEIKEA